MARMPRRPIEELMGDVTDEHDPFASHEEVTVPEPVPPPAPIAEAVPARPARRYLKNIGPAKVVVESASYALVWRPGATLRLPVQWTDKEILPLVASGLVEVKEG